MIQELLKNPVGILILAGVVVAATAFIFSRPPIPQAPSYHEFADRRIFFGVPNFLDVISNLPFLVLGVWGLFLVGSRMSVGAFFRNPEMWPYAVFFFGVTLTFFGSSYYHLYPTNARLVWDRLPMTLGFMGVLSATVAERINERAGVLLLAPLVVAGGLTVIYWYWTESHGHGDLRPYYLVQFGSLAAVLVILTVFPSRNTEDWCVALALALYGGAKLLESFDQHIYDISQTVSGHTLKHLAAAGAIYLILLTLERRIGVM